jgi:hypothetical protein
MFEKDHAQDALFELAVRGMVDGLYWRMSGRVPDFSAPSGVGPTTPDALSN